MRCNVQQSVASLGALGVPACTAATRPKCRGANLVLFASRDVCWMEGCDSGGNVQYVPRDPGVQTRHAPFACSHWWSPSLCWWLFACCRWITSTRHTQTSSGEARLWRLRCNSSAPAPGYVISSLTTHAAFVLVPPACSLSRGTNTEALHLRKC